MNYRKPSIKNIFSKLLHWLANLFFPDECVFCGRIIEAGSTYCGSCSLPEVGGSVCSKCGRELRLCICDEAPYCFMSCSAPFYYKGAAKRAVLALKEGRRAAASALADKMTASLLKSYGGEVISDFDFIAFVPMHKAKLRQNSRNHAELLAHELGIRLGLPVEPVLNKVRQGRPQHELDAQERKRNVIGMYDCAANLNGKRIILVDDVFTTGSTLNECTKQLLKCGAVCVIACVAALAEYISDY